MAIPSGTKFGSYQIVAPLGAGGMGEVYQAHDSKLGRDVSIKVLPEAFEDDPARQVTWPGNGWPARSWRSESSGAARFPATKR